LRDCDFCNAELQLKFSITEVAIAQVNSDRRSIGNGQAVPSIT